MVPAKDTGRAIFAFGSMGASLSFYFQPTKKQTIMSEEIQDRGRKGRLMLYLFVAFLLFIVLVVAIYKYNFKFLPA